ncbi:MAG: DUF420 domain-containing protein [Chloroflexota bacterium]
MQEICKALGFTCSGRFQADINLIAQLIMICSLWVGFYFARTKQIPKHRRVQTTVVIVNIFAIALIMIPVINQYVLRTGDFTTFPTPLLMSIHGTLGLIAELLGIYIVIRMLRPAWIPQRLKVKNFKRLMRITLTLWTLIIVLGLGIYFYRYLTTADGTPTATVVETPTATAVPPTATAVPPTNTPAPPAPTVVPARGALTFSNDKGLNDVATVKVSNVPPPPAGKLYQAWFASSNVQALASAGEVKVGADGTATVTYTDPNAGNLIAQYDQFFITTENAAATKPSTTLVFSGQFAARLSGEVKALIGSAGDTPNKVGYIVGLHDNGDHLLQHADELTGALVRNNLPALKRHAEHLINLLQGAKGANFGDGDGNGAVEDPGDGFGYLAYADQSAQHAQAMASAPDATDALKQRTTAIQSGAANVKKWGGTVVQDALAILAANNTLSVAAQVAEAATLSKAMVRGQGSDAGMQQMFFATQEAAGLSLTPFQVQVAQATALPTPTPTAAPTATPVPAPKTVTVLMQNFAFKDKNLTIEKGTTVVWPNKDNAKHTVTSDSGNPLNSKDVTANKSFSFMFTEAGTFPYYCEYHGDKGGVDMAGTITVK